MPEKRYFWLKLNEHFFNDHRIEYLLKKPGGEGAVIIYQKLLLMGINGEGQVYFFSDRRCDTKYIATALGVSVAKLRKCLEMLIDMELLVWNEDGSFFLPELICMVGKETGSAQRMRRKRVRDASQMQDPVPVTCDTEKEKEKQINKESESDTDSHTDSHSDADSLRGPTFDELLTICRARNYRVDIKAFMDFYRARNWMKGDAPITDWAQLLSLWDYSSRIKARDDNAMSGTH